MNIERIDYLIIPPKAARDHWYNVLQYIPEKDIWKYLGLTCTESEIQNYLTEGIITPFRDTLINY